MVKGYHNKVYTYKFQNYINVNNNKKRLWKRLMFQRDVFWVYVLVIWRIYYQAFINVNNIFYSLVSHNSNWKACIKKVSTSKKFKVFVNIFF